MLRREFFIGVIRNCSVIITIFCRKHIDVSFRDLYNDGETIWPDIWENYVIARVKPGGSNDLSYYRIMDLNEGREWSVLAAPTDSIYSDSITLELTSACFSDGYVSWWTNTQERYYIYSIEKNIVYALPGCGDDYSHSGLECQNGGQIVFHIGCTAPMEIYYCDISKLE